MKALTVSPAVRENAPAAAGDQDAQARLADFDALYAQHARFLWRTIRSLGASAADAEDLTHEVFLVAYRKLGAFEGRSSVRTWLCGIAIGLVRNHARKVKRHQDEPPPPAARSSPTERSEATNLLTRCLQDLDEQRRLLFVLAELEQLSGPEIAETLGLSVNTVYVELRHAREQLEASLQRHSGAPR